MYLPSVAYGGVARPEPLARHARLADAAVRALIDEAELTPKPALVDRRGHGAHCDLDLGLMRRSARSLHGAFARMAAAAEGETPSQALRERLASIGRHGETEMMAATGGSNSHRGAIWALGLLMAGAVTEGASHAGAMAMRAGQIARHIDRFAPASLSHGRRAAAIYGVGGARAEAEAGFPHVIEIGLPRLRGARARGLRETAARVEALLAIMVSLNDTCLLHRGGRQALEVARSGARAVLAAGGIATTAGLRRFDRKECELMALNASPGGAADLLAATLFLDGLERAEAPLSDLLSGRN